MVSIAVNIPREEYTNATKTLIALFSSKGTTLDLIRSLVRDEISKTSKYADPIIIQKSAGVSTLFRGNSLASNIMSTFFMSAGRNYLKQTLLPLLNKVIQKPSSFEVT